MYECCASNNYFQILLTHISYIFSDQVNLHDLAVKARIKFDTRERLGIKTRRRAQNRANQSNKIICDCGRQFITISQYNYHKRWECGRTFDCLICKRPFTTKSSLKYHNDNTVCIKDVTVLSHIIKTQLSE